MKRIMFWEGLALIPVLIIICGLAYIGLGLAHVADWLFLRMHAKAGRGLTGSGVTGSGVTGSDDHAR